MEKEKANILLPDGTIIKRTVKSVLKQVGATCMGSWKRTITYNNQTYRVKETDENPEAKYKLEEKIS